MEIYFEKVFKDNPTEYLLDYFDNFFKTIENLGGKLTDTKVDNVAEEKEFTLDGFNFGKILYEYSNVTFKYTGLDEDLTKIKTFLILMLELDSVEFDFSD